METTISNPLVNTSLKIDNLSCQRGERLLFSELCFALKSGQCLHIIGENGTGKSSLLRIITGLLEAESGSVTWGDHSNQSETYRANIAYLGHSDAIKNELTAVENLSYQQRLVSSKDDSQLDQILNKVGILHCADLMTHKLSFGQRRRLAFARLLLKDYKIWILDEPFTGIDVAGRELIESLCMNHLNHDGMIILTHHQSLENSRLAAALKTLQLSGSNS